MYDFVRKDRSPLREILVIFVIRPKIQSRRAFVNLQIGRHRLCA